MLSVESITVTPAMENCYAVFNEAGEALIIDPGGETQRIINWVEENKWQVKAVLLTHAHSDHIGALDDIRNTYQVEAYIHPIEQPFLLDPQLNLSANTSGGVVQCQPAEHEWQTMGHHQVAGFEFEVAHLPGHSPGHVVYLFKQEGFAIVGDTLFAGTIGRTDFPDGSLVHLLSGINDHLLSLPDWTIIYPGHGASTNIGIEKASNPFIIGYRQYM